MGQQAKIAAALSRAGIVKPEVWTPTGVAYNDATGKESLGLVATSPRPDSHLHEVRIHDEWLRKKQFQSTGLTAPRVVLTQGANDPLFVISFGSQQKNVGAMAWKCAGMICAGFAMLLFGFYVLLA
jgi:hypothetical protein